VSQGCANCADGGSNEKSPSKQKGTNYSLPAAARLTGEQYPNDPLTAGSLKSVAHVSSVAQAASNHSEAAACDQAFFKL
jgi:hypothetical protein